MICYVSSAVICTPSRALTTQLFELACVCMCVLIIQLFAPPSAVDHGFTTTHVRKDNITAKPLQKHPHNPHPLYCLPTMYCFACCLCDQRRRRTSWWLRAKVHKNAFWFATCLSLLLHGTLCCSCSTSLKQESKNKGTEQRREDQWPNQQSRLSRPG